ncbi:probable LRR receptor-like serine/threonine-protein kinase At1g56140 [Vitis riparia]|uniref:probable LRR receptor-like serine/threonine-protein kinase At1g56140 n=1 Tax=Vitis riparia TaxID=96939 RepID=UPI00155B2FA1|nr:probable LRR receptor-like serine/threonine-protein kinase At1g56140 [Vitis riparia]
MNYRMKLCAFSFFLLLLFQKSPAQNATLDPSEVETLNFLFNKWNMTSTEFWNMSGDPCSGPPITPSQYDDIYYKQAIKCNCTFNDNTTCHITHLKVLNLNKTGLIPKELTALTFLSDCKNLLSLSLSPLKLEA